MSILVRNFHYIWPHCSVNNLSRQLQAHLRIETEFMDQLFSNFQLVSQHQIRSLLQDFPAFHYNTDQPTNPVSDLLNPCQ